MDANGNITVNEGETITFRLQLDAALSDGVVFTDNAAFGGDARNGVDYTTSTQQGSVYNFGARTFSETTTQRQVTMIITEDSDPEDAATITWTLAIDPSSTTTDTVTITPTSFRVTIAANDNYMASTVAIADAAAVNEGAAATFTVTLNPGNPAPSYPVRVAYTAAITDCDSANVMLPDGSLDFTSSQTTSRDITVRIPSAANCDNGETGTLTVTITPPTGVTATDAMATATVNYITAAHTIGVAAQTVDEGAAMVTVTRAGLALTTPATIAWAATAGTATAADFTGGTLPSGTVTFSGSSTSQTITVPIADDSLSEVAETFTLTLSADATVLASNNQIALSPATATITITDSDAITAMSMRVTGPATVNEESSAVYTVDLGAEVTGSSDVTVAITTAGTATLTTDYTLSATSLTIAAGASSATFTLTTTNGGGDGTDDRTLTLTLTAMGGANTESMASVTQTITITEAAHTISIARASGESGAIAEGAAANFTITRTASDALMQPVTIMWAVSGGTGAGDASAADFGGSFPSGSVTFSGNDASQTVTVRATDDNLSEMTESFTVTITENIPDAVQTANNQVAISSSDNSATVMVTDNDLISISIGGRRTVNEEQAISIPVTLDAEPTADLTLTWAVAAASTVPGGGSLSSTCGNPSSDILAAAAGDFEPSGFPNGMLTFTGRTAGARGVTAQNIEFSTSDGGSDDTCNRVFTLTLSAVSGGGGAAATLDMMGTATFTISEDDPAARSARLEAPTAAVAKGIGQLASQAVAGRLRFNAGGVGNTLTVAGQNMNGNGMETLAAQYLAGGGDVSAAELLRQSGFSFTGGNGGRGFNFWGGGSYVSADGEDGGVSYDGDTTAFHVGIDTNWKDGLIGVAIGNSDGDTDFTVTADGMKSSLETDVVSVHPYLTRKFSNVQLWTTIGYGTGDAEIKEDDATIKTDLTVTTAALGATLAPLENVHLNFDGQWSRAELDAAGNAGRSLPKVTADNLRLNAGAELSGQRDAWRSFVTVNVRHDSGDGDTGAAGDLGGGVEWHSSTATLRLEGSKYLTGSGAEEERINFTARKTTGRLNLGLTIGMEDEINTANLLSGEWRF